MKIIAIYNTYIINNLQSYPLMLHFQVIDLWKLLSPKRLFLLMAEK